MAKQTFTTGQVLTAAQMTSLQQTALLGGAASAKTTSYTLVSADAGTALGWNSTSAGTFTVNASVFSTGDTVTIINQNSGTLTISAGTATINKPTNATLALVQNAAGILHFTSASAATFMPFDVGAASSGFQGFRAYRATNQTLTAATFTKVQLASETFDTNNWFDSSTNYRFTPTTAGYYLIQTTLTFSAGTRTIGYIYKNGSVLNQFADDYPAYSTTGGEIVYLNGSTDYIEMYAYIAGPGGSLSVLGDSSYTTMSGYFLGA